MPPTVLAGLPGSRARGLCSWRRRPRRQWPACAPTLLPDVLGLRAHTHPTPPPVAVGALNKHRRGEERPVSSLCSHTTHTPGLLVAAAQGTPLPAAPNSFSSRKALHKRYLGQQESFWLTSHTGSWRLGKVPQHGWRRAATRRPGQGVPVVLQVGSRCWLSPLFSGEGWRGGGSWLPSQPKSTWMS